MKGGGREVCGFELVFYDGVFFSFIMTTITIVIMIITTSDPITKEPVSRGRWELIKDKRITVAQFKDILQVRCIKSTVTLYPIHSLNDDNIGHPAVRCHGARLR